MWCLLLLTTVTLTSNSPSSSNCLMTAKSLLSIASVRVSVSALEYISRLQTWEINPTVLYQYYNTVIYYLYNDIQYIAI